MPRSPSANPPRIRTQGLDGPSSSSKSSSPSSKTTLPPASPVGGNRKLKLSRPPTSQAQALATRERTQRKSFNEKALLGSLPVLSPSSSGSGGNLEINSSRSNDSPTSNSPTSQRSTSSSPTAQRSEKKVKDKAAHIKLISKGWSEPWGQVKFKWRVVDGPPDDVYIGLYADAQTDTRCYEASLICHDRVSATSVFVAPSVPGTYAIMLVREPSEILTRKTFQVINPLDQSAGIGWIGSFVEDPEAPHGERCWDVDTYETLKETMMARAVTKAEDVR